MSLREIQSMLSDLDARTSQSLTRAGWTIDRDIGTQWDERWDQGIPMNPYARNLLRCIGGLNVLIPLQYLEHELCICFDPAVVPSWALVDVSDACVRRKRSIGVIGFQDRMQLLVNESGNVGELHEEDVDFGIIGDTLCEAVVLIASQPSSLRGKRFYSLDEGLDQFK